MADISLIEFVVYGLIAYSSLVTLIVSTAKPDVPTTKSGSMTRAIFFIPGIICAGILASSGVNITITSVVMNNTIIDLNSTETWTEESTTTSIIELQNPIWITFHLMIFIILIVYVIIQVLDMLGKKK